MGSDHVSAPSPASAQPPIRVLQSACLLRTRLQARAVRRCGGALAAMMRLQRLGALGSSCRRTLAAARNRECRRSLAV